MIERQRAQHLHRGSFLLCAVERCSDTHVHACAILQQYRGQFLHRWGPLPACRTIGAGPLFRQQLPGPAYAARRVQAFIEGTGTDGCAGKVFVRSSSPSDGTLRASTARCQQRKQQVKRFDVTNPGQSARIFGHLFDGLAIEGCAEHALQAIQTHGGPFGIEVGVSNPAVSESGPFCYPPAHALPFTRKCGLKWLLAASTPTQSPSASADPGLHPRPLVRRRRQLAPVTVASGEAPWVQDTPWPLNTAYSTYLRLPPFTGASCRLWRASRQGSTKSHGCRRRLSGGEFRA